MRNKMDTKQKKKIAEDFYKGLGKLQACFDSMLGDVNPFEPEPELPLSVRVAKALGKKDVQIVRDEGGKYLFIKSQLESLTGFIELPIPAYDSDLTLAMGALEEYCDEHNLNIEITICCGVDGYYVELSKYKGSIRTIKVTHKSLPTAICEAICKHAEEGK